MGGKVKKIIRIQGEDYVLVPMPLYELMREKVFDYFRETCFGKSVCVGIENFEKEESDE